MSDALATLPATVPLPTTWTTEAGYLDRRCNRCGDCCEAFWLPSIFDLTDALMWAFHDCARGSLERALRTLTKHAAPSQRFHPNARREVAQMKPCGADQQEDHARMCRQAHWLLDLEPLPSGGAVHERYRCTRFVRDASGEGRCTDYENRAPACVMYPMTHPRQFAPANPHYPRCSWFVNLIPVRRSYGPAKSVVEEAASGTSD